MKKLTPLNELDKFMGGALQERVALAIADITANIFNPNTKPDAVRKVKIELTIKPTKSRREAAVVTKVVTSLSPYNDLETTAQIGIDGDGALTMVEQSDIIDGQTDLEGEIHENNVAHFPAIVK